ncbi:nitroreductase family protein [Shewanella zhangzhouensis]|uniref:nitroreductase family protein n=1 Tax=Shewanella zhangzhouensis TaxID=2864213 RepID=UPI001C656402|nr:nitroreductase family protein [Shewanella zhangzhouensis]QYK07014.1 nitroreductase family protein [Shewanella zhangzhouensis]
MNTVIQQLLNRTSVRSFSGEKVKDSDLELILKAAQQAPSSINAQQISLIVTREKSTIEQIAKIAGGQPQVASAEVFITIVVDFNRTDIASRLANKKQIIEQSAEGIIVGAGDAGITLNALQTAANSLGYGTTAIGGIRNNPQAMIDLLKLPKKTFPIFGITLGVPNESLLPKIKPRVPLESYAMNEVYNHQRVEEGVKAYDETLRRWWDSQKLNSMKTYSEEVGMFYSNIYFSSVAVAFSQQGFKFSDK